ncbi:CDP-diacylglycerol--serine O-phosphatidyltransferase [Hanseniaspora valbyensis NRRL Y-1626]|uniref:CDP-diacylglycerol--serine O-phosphatidyltransferase n=1 Tax=Hanseniaspora valbyensis NRRL Y-1626 TaxID=766949 RepID=A0A1B7TFV6_9ASCO|nr:CDP-diacylglycerol--serine O-phosphatidyltransferase [Hanseniaspora valbyensis NRRL Y-1626]
MVKKQVTKATSDIEEESQPQLSRSVSSNEFEDDRAISNAIATTDDEDNDDYDGSAFVSKNSSRRSSIFSFDTSPLDPPNEIDISKFKDDSFHFSMIRNLHLADYITLMNGFCAFYSVISCCRYYINDQDVKYLKRSMLFVVLGMFFDFFDGRVARLRNRSSLMGQELDSLADLISFGMAPALIGFCCGLQTTVDCLGLCFFVLCGLTRLARFNVTVQTLPKDVSGKSKYFEGLPIPTSLFWIMVFHFLVRQNLINDNLIGGVLFKGQFNEFHILTLGFVLHGSGMISKSLKIPKP